VNAIANRYCALPDGAAGAVCRRGSGQGAVQRWIWRLSYWLAGFCSEPRPRSTKGYTALGLFTVNNGAGTQTQSVALGSNPSCFVIIGAGQSSAPSVSGVTVGSVSLSKIAVINDPNNNNDVDLWGGSLSSCSGTQSVVVTWGGTTNDLGMAVWVVTGLNSTTAKSHFANAYTTAIGGTLNVTSGDFVFSFAAAQSGLVFPPTAVARRPQPIQAPQLLRAASALILRMRTGPAHQQTLLGPSASPVPHSLHPLVLIIIRRAGPIGCQVSLLPNAAKKPAPKWKRGPKLSDLLGAPQRQTPCG
jgi:hypothetical protein